MNSTGMIDCIAYDYLFDGAMPMFKFQLNTIQRLTETSLFRIYRLEISKMKHTPEVTTVLAIVAQGVSEYGFWYPITFFYALTIGVKYKVDLTNF